MKDEVAMGSAAAISKVAISNVPCGVILKPLTLSCRKRGMCGKRVMTPHLVCVLCLKRVMAVQVYTVEPFPVKQIITYFLSKTVD